MTVSSILKVDDIVEYSAAHWPGRVAIIDAAGKMTYAELRRGVDAAAAALCAAGVGAGAGIGIRARNGRSLVCAIFASMRVGAVVMPLSHQLKAAEMSHIVEVSGLHAVLDDGGGAAWSARRPTSVDVCETAWSLHWTERHRTEPFSDYANAAFVRYTSGTTGEHKGVVLSHTAVIERIETAQSALQLTPHDVVLWVLPMAYHFLVSIVLYIRYGVAIAVCPDILAASMLACAAEHRTTLLYASPLHIRLLAADKSDATLGELRWVISTSSGLPAGVAEAFLARYGTPVTQAYGIIEAGLPLLESDEAFASADTVGVPAPRFEVAILNAVDAVLPIGEVGRLAIRGPGMFDGYLRPHQTRESLMENGWFMTGDLARRCADGRIAIVGREKSMINVAGNKVFPEEVEAVLMTCPQIKSARVFGREHPIMGEIVGAEVVVDHGMVPDVETLIGYCRERLSTFKVPQSVRLVDAIALTGSGKVKRI